MPSSKPLLIVCAAVCAFSVRGADNEAQAAARQQVESKVRDLQIREAPPGGDAQATAEFIKAMRQEMQDSLAQTPSEPTHPMRPLAGQQPRPETKPVTPAARASEVATGWGAQPTTQKPPPARPRKELLAAEPTPSKEPGRTAEVHPGKLKKPDKQTLVLGAASAFPPLETPPLALSVAQQQRLQELLDKYRANEIGATEYHLRRATVLSEQ